MNKPLVYGKEHTFLDQNTEILYRNSNLKQTAPLHTHTFYEFFLVVEGKAYHLVNNSVQSLSKGDLVFIRPNDVHSYDFNYSDDFRIYNLGFSKTIFSSVVTFFDSQIETKLLCQQSLPPTLSLSRPLLETLSKLFKQVENAQSEYEKISKSPNSNSTTSNTTQKIRHIQYLAKSVISFCFQVFLSAPFLLTESSGELSSGALSSGAPNSSELSSKEFVADKRDWLNDVLSEMSKTENFRIGFSKMLSLAGCSESHLCRLCQSRLKCSPTEFINEKRLIYASYLLTCTTESVLSVCEMCGFNNASHFYHLFKKKYGKSPAQFRKVNI